MATRFRNEYRIKETRYLDGSGYFRVHIKCWWFPIWRLLDLPGWFHFFCEKPCDSEYVETRFDTLSQAMGFALDHANKGLDAFFTKNRTYTYTNLGKLP